MLYLLAAAVVGTVAAFTDVRWRIIPNWLVLFTLAAGFGWHGLTSTLPVALWGFLYGSASLVLYLFGMLSPGDVKLVAALGSLVGPVGIMLVFTAAYLAFGVYSVALLLVTGDWKDNLRREWRMFCLYGLSLWVLITGLKFARVRELTEEIKACQGGLAKVPFGVFVWVGILATALLVRGW